MAGSYTFDCTVALWELVSDPGLRKLIEYLAPEYKIPCPKTMTNKILTKYELIHGEVCKHLEEVEYVSLIQMVGLQ